jgi:hypothetical protein
MVTRWLLSQTARLVESVLLKPGNVYVTSKPELGFYPKRWEDREIPAPVELIEELGSIRIVRTANLCFRPLLQTANSDARALQIYRQARQTGSDKV